MQLCATNAAVAQLTTTYLYFCCSISLKCYIRIDILFMCYLASGLRASDKCLYCKCLTWDAHSHMHILGHMCRLQVFTARFLQMPIFHIYLFFLICMENRVYFCRNLQMSTNRSIPIGKQNPPSCIRYI